MGYPGALTATSGNYGAAVASCCAKSGLPASSCRSATIRAGSVSRRSSKKRVKCEALGAEVVQLTVGPELFYTVLRMLEDTGYFNASLYTAFGIAGIETLGYEVAEQCRAQIGKDPDVVVCTNAGGGNLTGTARGLSRRTAAPQIVAATVNLKGLHMASDTQFNKKSFTTGHTGFGMPFSTWPDRSDVPRSAARPLRYMDRYVTVNQGEVFYTTELLARLEGIERGPAGNTSLAAAISLAQELPEDGSSSCRRRSTPARANTAARNSALRGKTASSYLSAIRGRNRGRKHRAPRASVAAARRGCRCRPHAPLADHPRGDDDRATRRQRRTSPFSRRRRKTSESFVRETLEQIEKYP